MATHMASTMKGRVMRDRMAKEDAGSAGTVAQSERRTRGLRLEEGARALHRAASQNSAGDGQPGPDVEAVRAAIHQLGEIACPAEVAPVAEGCSHLERIVAATRDARRTIGGDDAALVRLFADAVAERAASIRDLREPADPRMLSVLPAIREAAERAAGGSARGAGGTSFLSDSARQLLSGLLHDADEVCTTFK
jgi:hypothetical protein